MIMDSLSNQVTRRQLLARAPLALGSVALASLCRAEQGDLASVRHLAPRAKRVIYLFMSGGPSHVDTFDPKPTLAERHGQEMPPELIRNHEFAMIKEARPKVKGSPCTFQSRGQSGTEVSELFPHVGNVVDEIGYERPSQQLHEPTCAIASN